EHLRTAATRAPEGDAREVTSIMARELTGVLEFARGKRGEGLAELARAAAADARRPPPIGRPYPIKPAAELYGEFLLASGDAQTAFKQFEASLARTPRRAASLFGLASTAAAASDSDAASRTIQEFLDVWHLADSDRPELADARRIRDTVKR